MGEPEVKPLVALVGGRPQILGLVFLGHGAPHPLTAAVNPHIEYLRAHEHANIVRDDAENDLVTGIVVRLIGLSIDLGVSAKWPATRQGLLTLLPMMLLACTHMLYNALATVRVLTLPALRLVMATIKAWT